MVTKSPTTATPSVRKEKSRMTIKELYDEVKYLMASGYGDYEVEIADPEEDDFFPLDDGYFDHGNKVTLYGKEQ